MSQLWRSLAGAGFKLENAKIVSIKETGEDSYRLFADSMESKVFFTKYVNNEAVIAEIDSGAGRFLFLIGPAKGGTAMIRGLTGPLS